MGHLLKALLPAQQILLIRIGLLEGTSRGLQVEGKQAVSMRLWRDCLLQGALFLDCRDTLGLGFRMRLLLLPRMFQHKKMPLDFNLSKTSQRQDLLFQFHSARHLLNQAQPSPLSALRHLERLASTYLHTSKLNLVEYQLCLSVCTLRTFLPRQLLFLEYLASHLHKLRTQ